MPHSKTLALLAVAVAAGSSCLFAAERQPAARATGLLAAIAEIEAGRRTTPLIGEPGPDGEATVTFLARREGARVPRIVSDVTGWGEHVDGTFDFNAGAMARIGRSRWYFLDAKVAARARIEYLIAYGLTDYRPDPHNPRLAAGPRFGGARASEFVMPGYVLPLEFAEPAGTAMAGRTAEGSIASRSLGGPRRVIVYTPPGYRSDVEYPVVVWLDLRIGPVSRVVEWLIGHGDIEPMLVVCAEPAVPGLDYPAAGPLRAFITAELPAWLASRYAVSRNADKRAIIGVSYDAKDVLDAALGPASPDLPAAEIGGADEHGPAFARLGLLIPGRRLRTADMAAFAARRSHSLSVAIVAGRYDRANIATARELRKALDGAGHRVQYLEVPEGHSAVTWAYHLREVLVSLFGTRQP